MLESDDCLRNFAKRAKNLKEVPTKCDGAILALVTLGNAEGESGGTVVVPDLVLK